MPSKKQKKLKTKTKIIIAVSISAVVIISFCLLSIREIPSEITYGASFSKFHSDELQLDWKETYFALLDDLGIKRFRFSAHWPMIEPEEGKFNFEELDFQMEETRRRDIPVILSVGRRLPGWPECHDPFWAADLPKEEKQQAILNYIEAVVERYKGYPNLEFWQVENEPFLTLFARSHCGPLDRKFLQKEIDLVKQLDPSRQVMITDSGEFGPWIQAKRAGDIFGTSLYLYIWSPTFGKVRYPVTPSFFKIKRNITEILTGTRGQKSVIIELSAEPWLLQPIITTSLEIQLDRMGIDKLNEKIEFSSKTGFDEIYLWGVEWWYWLKLQGYPDHWDRGKELFSK